MLGSSSGALLGEIVNHHLPFVEILTSPITVETLLIIVTAVVTAVLTRWNDRKKLLFKARLDCYGNVCAKMSNLPLPHGFQDLSPLLFSALLIAGKPLHKKLKSMEELIQEILRLIPKPSPGESPRILEISALPMEAQEAIEQYNKLSKELIDNMRKEFWKKRSFNPDLRVSL